MYYNFHLLIYLKISSIPFWSYTLFISCVHVHVHTGYEIGAHGNWKCTQKIILQKNNYDSKTNMAINYKISKLYTLYCSLFAL